MSILSERRESQFVAWMRSHAFVKSALLYIQICRGLEPITSVGVFHLMARDTPRWSEDNSGGIVVLLCRQDGSDCRTRSMRDLLPFGLIWVKEGTTWCNEKLYKIYLRCENKWCWGFKKLTLKSPNKRKVENWVGFTICNVVQKWRQGMMEGDKKDKDKYKTC